MHRFYAPGATAPATVLSAAETHHLARVLRLAAGAEVVVFDGDGHEWLGRVRTLTRAGATVNLVALRTPAVEPAVHVTLAIALLKGAELDEVIRDATMLGVGEIAPIVSAHIAVRDRSARDEARERWTRVAVASAKQCARAVVPRVRSVTTLEDVLSDLSFDERIVCVEPVRGDTRLRPISPHAPRRVLLSVGPEGGWSAPEIEFAIEHGACCLSLGPRVLRAVRAPTVALASLWTAWGWP